MLRAEIVVAALFGLGLVGRSAMAEEATSPSLSIPESVTWAEHTTLSVPVTVANDSGMNVKLSMTLGKDLWGEYTPADGKWPGKRTASVASFRRMTNATIPAKAQKSIAVGIRTLLPALAVGKYQLRVHLAWGGQDLVSNVTELTVPPSRLIVAPLVLRWAVGSPAKAQVVRVIVHEGPPVKQVILASSNPDTCETRLSVVHPGTEYAVSVVPLATTLERSATVSITVVAEGEKDLVYSVGVAVEKPRPGTSPDPAP